MDKRAGAYPKMTAFHTIKLFSVGAPLTPLGGSAVKNVNMQS